MSLSDLLRRPASLGALMTAVLFVFPGTYQYAPIVGGLVAGAMFGTSHDGFNVGLLFGLVMLPVGALLTLVTMVSPSIETGATAVLDSMGAVGPKNIFFYGILVSFIVMYSVVAGSLSGVVAGFLSGLVQGRSENE